MSPNAAAPSPSARKPAARGKPSSPTRLVVLVATRKGAWLFHGDARRKAWTADGPHFLGHNISHLTLDPRDGRTLLAAAKTGHLGPTVFRSTDLGRHWKEAKQPPAFANPAGGPCEGQCGTGGRVFLVRMMGFLDTHVPMFQGNGRALNQIFEHNYPEAEVGSPDNRNLPRSGFQLAELLCGIAGRSTHQGGISSQAGRKQGRQGIRQAEIDRDIEGGTDLKLVRREKVEVGAGRQAA